MASSSGKALENSSPISTPRRMFSLRIVNLDYYMASPLPGMDVCYSEFQGRGVREVPVVRIFGSTTSGQKTCLHLHKAFPYFYVPYDSELPQEVNEALGFVRSLASSIEKAMKMASTVGAKRQHLHSCSLVRGKKYYGYHPNEQLFIKIVLYYPQEVSRVSTLLLSGGIMNHKFEPHEAHFPYLLQILIDHNLFGMGHLHLSSLKFRNPLPEALSDLKALVKRVKRDFSDHEAISQVEAVAVDPSKDYSSLKENVLKEEGVSTSPLLAQLMKETPTKNTGDPLTASTSCSPVFHQIPMKEEILSAPHPKFLTTVKEELLGTLPPDHSSSPAYHQTTMKEGTSRGVPSETFSPARHPNKKKEGTLSTLPGQKSSSPAIYQMTPDAGSQPEMWLQKSVPGDWVWPLLASDNIEKAVQGQGLYSRQSTCELEADASVEDILNRGELLFLPLQQAGPEIKMVQSLTPMWEEERGRSGEGGPAGSIDPLYQPTARTVPIPSPFEEAMRDTLFQIARAEEHDLGAKYGSQSSTEKSDAGSRVEPVLEICTLLGSQQEMKISVGSEFNSASPSDEDETYERQQSSVPLEVHPNACRDSRSESTQTRHDLAIAINEEVIRKQVSQKCLSQDLDKEVAEFLRWMGATQLDMEEQEDGDRDSKDGEIAQMVLSQMFSSPGMDAALLKALADYENATEQECQAILDCADIMDEEEEDVVDHNNLNEYSRGEAKVEGDESEKAQMSPDYRVQSHESPGKNIGKRAPPDIPQTDGAGDADELENEGDRSLQSFSSKKPRHDRKDWFASATSKNDSSRSGLQEFSNHQKREVSLRDMMRKRRERKPGKKELYPPSSSMLEGFSSEAEPDFPKDNEGTVLSPEVRHQRLREANLPQDKKLRVVFGEDSPQNEDLLTTTNRVSLERHLAFRQKGKVIQKSENVNNMLTSKFGTLPVVTLKYDSGDVNCHNDQLLEKYSKEGFGTSLRESEGVTEHNDKLDLPLESSSEKSCGKKLIPKEVTSKEYITTMQSRGDDRDCGGGETSFGLDHDSLIESAPGRILELYVNSSRRDTRIEMVEAHPREPDDHLADYKPEVDSADEDDFFVAQTQFGLISVPESPESGQLLSEAVDVDMLDKVDILSQSSEAVMMSQVPNLAVPQLTSQNRTDPYEEREENLVLDRSFQDSDCLRVSHVVKPDVSYMTELRPVHFEKYGDNVRVEIQVKDFNSAEQTQILRPFIPFLDSGDPRDCPHDHIVDIEEPAIADEDDEVAGQTQILELDNLQFSEIPPTVLTECLREVKESDIPNGIDQVLEQTQVLNLEEPPIINSDRMKSGVFQVSVRERDVAGDDVQIKWSTPVLEVCSSQYRELRRGEIGGFSEGMADQGSLDESGDRFEQTPKLDCDRIKYAARVREDDTPEDSQCDFGAQTQIPTPEEVFPLTSERGTTLELLTTWKVDEISDNHIPKVLEAELISTPSPVLPFETIEIPSKVELLPCLHGERQPIVGVSSSSAYAAQTFDGLNLRENNPTQYIFCDMSDDSEESYDSEQDRWCRDEGVNTSALFEDQEIGESGSRYCEDYQLEEGCLAMGKESGWDDAAENTREGKSPPSFEVKSEDQPLENIGRPSGAGEHIRQRGGRLCTGNSWDNASKDADEKFTCAVSEAQKKVQDVEQIGGPSAAYEDVGNVGCHQPGGVHSTQYLFTDMSDDSEASNDSGPDARELSWNAAKDYFSEEEEGGDPCAAEDERSFGLQTGRKSDIRMEEREVQGGISQVQNCLEIILQKPLLMDITAGKDGQKSDLVIAENSDRKYDPEFPCPPLSSLKFPNPLEDGTSRRSQIISSGSDPSTVRALICLSGLSLESFHPDFGNKSASTKLESSHVSEGNVKPSVVPWLDSAEDEDSEVMMEESTLHLFCENSLQARETGGKACAGKDAKDVPLQTQSQTVLVAPREITDWNLALVPFSKLKVEEQLMPLIFHQRPPTRHQITESFKEIACNYKKDDIFYGNVKDVFDHPVVRAGLVFDVKSREGIHLRPFQFGISSRRSNFSLGSKHRVYVQQESWGCEERVDIGGGIPTYIDNDGTKLYIITPARAPPSPRAVKQWLSLQSVQHMEVSNRSLTVGQQIFTMDPNTGKLVPVVEIGSVANTQESNPKTDSSQEDGEFIRPASPKYDERHVFFLSHSSTTSSSHSVPHSRSATKYGDLSVNISSASALAERDRPCSPGLSSLAPCYAQTSRSQATSLVNINDGKEVPQKNSSSALPVDSRVEELLQSKLDENAKTKSGKQWRDVSQMTALTTATTPLSQSGFRDPASSGLGQQITLMSIEVFSETRGDLLPDPRYDAVGCIVLVLHEDDGRSGNTDITVVLIRDKEAHSSRRYPDGIQGCELIYLPDEKALFRCFAQLVRLCDPDMLVGWEVQGFSLGLLAERAANLGISLLKQLSRIPPVSTASSELFDKEVGGEDQPEAALFDRVQLETIGVDEPIIDDEWGRTHGSGLYIGGRTVLNAWRIMRGEVKLNIYSIEAVAEAVLRRRVPRLPWQTLTTCFVRGPSGGRHHCIQYFINRARLTLEIMEQLDLVNRTAELARVFGIDFYSVFSRGSQFRVESMMARLAHTQNYLLVSPTRQQVAEQPGMQCLPLVMEPESRFYNSPVIVLDFQSLYPSMIIAYNLCFSTCLGKLSAENPKVLGVTKLKLDPGTLSRLKESMTITPNGIMFAPKEVLPGVLPRLLQEILSTRIMVKKAMKALTPEQRVLERVLNARQFALKLIANVTYGYTAAGFSGRMPCAEIADSIVQCGRLTLERAINMVNSNPRWNARVVYGDTDSMFVLCEGRSKDEAFKIGQEIAASVTETNPPPVTLKLEKVYLPCVLLTKKRYVGYSFESPSQLKPIFDAKGIETIRRDTCPAVAKALEHSLRLLFETQDLSQVKQYLQRQWGKILSGRISIQDFVFAKEVRLGTYSARSPVLPPAAIVASKAMAVDPRAEPRYAERIPYVVVHGEPGARLVDMVVDPLTLVTQPSLRLHDTYYITKQIIPACQRIFMLVGVDLRAWFSEMPRVYRPPTSKRVSNLAMGAKSTKWDPDAAKFKRNRSLRHGTIDQYFLSRHCTICGEFTRASQLLCSKCVTSPRAAAVLLPGRTARLEKEYKHLEAICRHCGGGDSSLEKKIDCISLDCSVFFERRKVHRELIAAGAVSSDLGYYPPCLPELY